MESETKTVEKADVLDLVLGEIKGNLQAVDVTVKDVLEFPVVIG